MSKFKEGDRIRLAENISQELPFLRKGAVGAIQGGFPAYKDDEPAYFLIMDPVGKYSGEDLDYWVATESTLEAESD
jgi:hypothetical protein